MKKKSEENLKKIKSKKNIKRFRANCENAVTKIILKYLYLLCHE
jgi:hypothetical protein